jgi:ABC-type transport system involved in cytochrome bd biosynthesis fused ATPase/permease subunit
VGIGLMIGPVLGQALYTLVNFEKTFYIFAGALLLAMIIVMIIIPSHLNHADDVATKAEID